jgi:hypothetical protein
MIYVVLLGFCAGLRRMAFTTLGWPVAVMCN